jgi:hypothetical protein
MSDDFGSANILGCDLIDRPLDYLAFSYRYYPIVFSPRFLLAGGLPVAGLC